MQLTVTAAATHKTAEYEDAFAPCPDCDDNTPICKVMCSHGGTTITSTYVPETALLDTIARIFAIAERLAPRIDAANKAFSIEMREE